MLKRILCVALLLVLSACGNESTKQAHNDGTNAVGKNSSSIFNSYLSANKICDVLTAQVLQNLAGGAQEIEKAASNFRDNFSCTYSWPRSDAKEREANMLQATMASMSGKGPKLSMRDRMTEYQVVVAVQKSSRSADSFVPRKLSEEQINARVKEAKQRTAERLTDDQKEVAGDAANSMFEKLLRKNNENQEVPGLADAAYWSDLGTGSLQVLDSDVQISISPMLADTKVEDMENAKKIASLLLE
jgi:hypothetical protein